jgi:hypothetical protein
MRSYYTITAADAHANSLTKRAELTLTQSTFFAAEQLIKLKLPEQPKQLELFEQLWLLKFDAKLLPWLSFSLYA